MSDDEPQNEAEAPAVEEKPKLSIQVGVEDGKVITLFSQQLTSFTLPPEDAKKMGEALIVHAAEADRLSTP